MSTLNDSFHLVTKFQEKKIAKNNQEKLQKQEPDFIKD